jgi:hypothetical protein
MKSNVVYFKNGQWNGLDNLENEKSAVQIILVFAERSLLENDSLVKQLKSSYINANVITCSTAGEINNRQVEENTAVCVAMSFEKTAYNFAVGNISQHKNSFDLGKDTASKLPAEDLKYIFVISDGGLINGDEITMGIQASVNDSVLISGGLAGDGANFQRTLVGFDENIQAGNVVLMGLYGDHIKVGTGFKGGWDVFGPERTITKSDGNVLFEIDNENALDMYKMYLGKYAEGLPSSALLFPISIKSENNDFFIVRTILSVDEKNKTMTFAGNLPQGSVVRFMKSNFDRLVQAASEAGTSATLNLGDNIPAELAIIVSCVGRKLVLMDRIEEEVEAAIDNITPGATVAGFFSYGEIAPQADSKKSHFSHLHNQTITITTFAELP